MTDSFAAIGLGVITHMPVYIIRKNNHYFYGY